MSTSRTRWEILLLLAITFGMAGVRSILRLSDSLLNPVPLNQQQTTLNVSQSVIFWVDLALQTCSSLVLFAWGGMALFVLAGDGIRLPRPRWSDLSWGAALAAIIGIPGLGLYLFALHSGLSKVVVPTGIEHAGVEIPVLLLNAAGNAFGEEVVVVMWLLTRLRQLRWRLPAALAASSVLRGSYHLYQGISAGFGNFIMGLVFGFFHARTGRVWPLVIAHFLIDAIAFVGYAALGDRLAFLS